MAEIYEPLYYRLLSYMWMLHEFQLVLVSRLNSGEAKYLLLATATKLHFQNVACQPSSLYCMRIGHTLAGLRGGVQQEAKDDPYYLDLWYAVQRVRRSLLV